jgi:hypothetical protein
MKVFLCSNFLIISKDLKKCICFKEAYVDFMLINQRVPINEFAELESMKAGWENTIKSIQTMASKER